MNRFAAVLIVVCLPDAVEPIRAADVPPEVLAAAMKRRNEIPLGGDFKPDPQRPAFVAVGHGGRILLSHDDGNTWKQVFWGYAGSDHGPWATKAIAYTNGVFVVPIGWGAPGAWLASEDGINWTPPRSSPGIQYVITNGTPPIAYTYTPTSNARFGN